MSRLRWIGPLLVALCLCGVPSAAAAAAAPRCNGEAALCARTFDRVVLAGAHNAMSAAEEGFQFPNQRIGIAKQLQLGVRAFLIDAYYAHVGPDGKVVKDDVKAPGDGLYLCHIVCENGATPLAVALRTMTTFLDAHPGNVLELDVEDYVSPGDFAAEVTAAGLDKHLYRGKPGPRWPTLATMIATRGQVVVLAEHSDGGPLVPWWHEGYAGVLQETPYTFKTPSLLTSPSQRKASCAPNRGGRIGSLLLMNHWSPPFAPTATESRKVNARSAIYGRALACRKRRGLMPTTIATDRVDVGGLLAAVHALNALKPAPAAR